MIVLVLIALVGVTVIVTRSTLFRPLQALWPALFSCSMCAGMWVGMIAGARGLVLVGHDRLTDTFLSGTATSLLSLLADAVLIYLLGDPSKETTT